MIFLPVFYGAFSSQPGFGINIFFFFTASFFPFSPLNVSKNVKNKILTNKQGVSHLFAGQNLQHGRIRHVSIEVVWATQGQFMNYVTQIKQFFTLSQTAPTPAPYPIPAYLIRGITTLAFLLAWRHSQLPNKCSKIFKGP